MLDTLLGNYRIIEQLGEGSMGVVYAGRHEQLGHRVAVKVLRRELSHSATVMRRFFNEAQAATAIRNPGIVQVFDFGATPTGCAYFVMELLEGVSLGKRLAQRRLEVAECCRIARQIANVLQSAHAAGIVHRDLKPDNLFLVSDVEVIGGERVKVLDFGIAKLACELFAGGVQTRADLVMGTPSYMAPEQCRSAAAADARSDIYALGCVLFRMLCARPPFVGAGPGEIMAAHLHAPPPSLLDRAPAAPAALAALVARMLAKQSAARPQTMAAVSLALDEILRELAAQRAHAPSPSGVEPTMVSVRALAPLAPASSSDAPLSTTGAPRPAPRPEAPAPVALPAARAPAPRPAPPTHSCSLLETAPLPLQRGAPPTSAQTNIPSRPNSARRIPASLAVPDSARQIPSHPFVATPSESAPVPITAPGFAPAPRHSRAPTPLPMDPLFSTSTTLASSAGVASGFPPVAPSRHALLMSGIIIVMAAMGSALVLLLTADGDGASALGHTAAHLDDRSSSAAATADLALLPQPPPPQPPPPQPPPALAPPAQPPPALAPPEQAPPARAPLAQAEPRDDAAVVPPPPLADDLESECNGLMVDHRWDELARCADQLALTSPQRAVVLKARAASALALAPHVEAVQSALQTRDLSRARAELDQLPPGAAEHPALEAQLAAAEAQALTALGGKLAWAMSPTCAAYNQVLARERDALPPALVAEATRRVPCAPVVRGRCDAAALAEQGRQLYNAGRYIPSLWRYEAAWHCSPGPQIARRAFVVACNLPNAAKARLFWRRLPPAIRPTAVTTCLNNHITQQQLDAP